MNIALIVIGTIFICIGLVRMFTEKAEAPAPQPPTAKEKGNLFEDYVANLFKDSEVFTVLQWNQGQTSSEGVYAKADENPDFMIEQTLKDGFKLTYWVECKYRSVFNDSEPVNIPSYQLNRYRKIQRESRRKVLVAIGVKGTPSAPQYFYVVPLDSIETENLTYNDLKSFYLADPSARFPSYVENYFTRTVFKKK